MGMSGVLRICATLVPLFMMMFMAQYQEVVVVEVEGLKLKDACSDYNGYDQDVSCRRDESSRGESTPVSRVSSNSNKKSTKSLHQKSTRGFKRFTNYLPNGLGYCILCLSCLGGLVTGLVLLFMWMGCGETDYSSIPAVEPTGYSDYYGSTN